MAEFLTVSAKITSVFYKKTTPEWKGQDVIKVSVICKYSQKLYGNKKLT